MPGQYVKMGTKIGTSYAPTSEGLVDLIEDFYGHAHSLFKSQGAATYGDNGYFNAIMGKELSVAMFTNDNAFTVLGSKPYNHEGVRIVLEQADYGMSNGSFVGIGATTVQDGAIPPSVRAPVDEFREPYKDLPYAYDLGLGLMAVENKDDVASRTDYIKIMMTTYTDLIDKSLLKPMSAGQPVFTDSRLGRTAETSLTGIERAIGAYSELGKTENGVTITADMLCPYGGSTGDFSARATKESNLDGQVIDLKGGNLSLGDMKKLYRSCSVNWRQSASPNGKVFFMSNISQDRLASLLLANNLYLDSVFVTKGFGGVQTIPGREVGMNVAAFNQIPIIQSGNMNFDFTTKKVSAVKAGDVLLLDTDHIHMSVLTPVEYYTVNNPAVNRVLQEMNVLNMRAELRIDSFIQHGKIVNIADEVV